MDQQTVESRQENDVQPVVGARSKREIVASMVYSYPEAAECLWVSERTLRREVDRGHLRYVVIAGRIVFRGRDLISYLDKNSGIGPRKRKVANDPARV